MILRRLALFAVERLQHAKVVERTRRNATVNGHSAVIASGKELSVPTQIMLLETRMNSPLYLQHLHHPETLHGLRQGKVGSHWISPPKDAFLVETSLPST
jgi:hypothetical protein